MLGGIFTVGGYTLLSRLTGFARDIMLAAILGAGPMADAFFVAQRLPNLFRSLFAEGAFKNTNSRPKFERRVRPREVSDMLRHGVSDDAIGMSLADLLVVDKPPKKSRARTASTQEPKNYGVDISTLARLIEEGKI